MNTDKLNDKEFVEYCKDARRKGATSEQWGYAELLMKACSRLTAAEEEIKKLKGFAGNIGHFTYRQIEEMSDDTKDLLHKSVQTGRDLS